MAIHFQDVNVMEVGQKVCHKFHKWQGVVEATFQQEDIVYVRWLSSIALIYNTELLVLITEV